MKTRDCFYGQVRAVTETHFDRQTTWSPAAIHVTERNGFTWDNATGMNPLHDKATVPVQYDSYGRMLASAARGGFTFVDDFIESKRSADFYNKQIDADFKNHYARLCQMLSIFWGMHRIISQDDNGKFDFVITRQFDTWWKNHSETNDRLNYIFGEHTKTLSASTPNIQNIPLAYSAGINHHANLHEYKEFAVIGATRSAVTIFNQAALQRLKSTFFNLALKELETVYKQTNTDLQSNLLSWNPGYNIYRILAKCDIHVIDINHFNVVGIKPGWGRDVSHDYGHTLRSAGDSD